MKYKILKKIEGFEIGETFDEAPFFYKGNKLPISFLIKEGYIEEIKENKPIYKVGDYAVYEWLGSIEYLKINIIYKYKDIYTYNGYKAENLRKPTQEELQLYFR